MKSGGRSKMVNLPSGAAPKTRGRKAVPQKATKQTGNVLDAAHPVTPPGLVDEVII